ncbi:hypothetical protein [Skermania piniformis]|uniref:Uncharacterized protein n=1 Tax=Skermania pinensis TaxID=39122 RepID=A0ABX8SCH2_9ACTN|nr:hypothetical protein [Skermania piniformis]QXQ15021.1 hypothetical protein KV203_06605 [Skermania piniformis]
MHDPLFPVPDGYSPPSGLLPDLPKRPRRRMLLLGAGTTAVVAVLAVLTTDPPRPTPPHAAGGEVTSPHLSATGSLDPGRPRTSAATGTDPETFVRDYYGKLPADATAAWADYDEYYQDRTGRAAFDEFWASVASVAVLAATPRDRTTVELTLRYVTKAGLTDTEQRWVRVIEQDNRLLIHDSERIGPA